MEKIKHELESMSLFDVQVLRDFIHKRYSGLFMMGALMPIDGNKALAEKYVTILSACDNVFEHKLNEYLKNIE